MTLLSLYISIIIDKSMITFYDIKIVQHGDDMRCLIDLSLSLSLSLCVCMMMRVFRMQGCREKSCGVPYGRLGGAGRESCCWA